MEAQPLMPANIVKMQNAWADEHDGDGSSLKPRIQRIYSMCTQILRKTYRQTYKNLD